MTLYALAAGFFSVGLALAVLGLYSIAVVRGCIGWRLGLYVIVVAAVQVGLVLLSTLTLLAVPEVVRAQPWRPGAQAGLFTALSLGLFLITLHVREKVTSECRAGHEDWWHHQRRKA